MVKIKENEEKSRLFCEIRLKLRICLTFDARSLTDEKDEVIVSCRLSTLCLSFAPLTWILTNPDSNF